jgi:HPt (histidine-containing phosphotransfer) domain-containing protein
MDDYVSKPMTPEELRTALQRWTAAPALDGPPAAPALERGALEAILASTTPAFAVEIIDLFLRDTPKRLDALSAAARAGDGAGLDRVAHGLRGSAAMIGALGMAGLCSRVEALVEEGRVGEAVSAAQQLVEAYTDTREALEAERRRFDALAGAPSPAV